MCNVNNASKWLGKKKKEKRNISKTSRGRKEGGKKKEKKRKEEDAKEILYCWKLVVNRKGVNEGETLDRFIGVGLHKKSALCAV